MIALGLVYSLYAADVPAPVPIRTDVKVGSYYFPGHFHAGRWTPMAKHGEPVPLLGYYRDGAPGVADWHIKWAVEHGISYFVYDWYYDHHNAAVGSHNTALDEGFLKAEHRNMMEFAIFWCNEEGLDEAPYTEDQMMDLARVLGERYFSQPNYLRIAGRPVVVISVPERLWQSFGEGFPPILDRMSREAGLADGEDIFLVAKQSSEFDKLEMMGFSACTAYNYAGSRLTDTTSPLRATYDDMVEAYESIWKRVKVLFGWEEAPAQDAIAPRISEHLTANPDHAKQVVLMLQQDGSPVGQLVGTIDAEKVIVAQNIIGTINM